MGRTGWFVLAGAAIVSLVVALLVLLRPTPPAQSNQNTPPTPEQKAYLSQLTVTDAKMTEAENYLGQTIFYLNGKVTNKGAKTIGWLEVELEFHDVLDQVVLRETTRPLRPGAPALKPGETRSFVVAFEHLPAEWNQAPPAITPKSVTFQ